jgi:hypothetical protein
MTDLQTSLDRLADHVEASLDMRQLESIVWEDDAFFRLTPE